MPKGIKKNHVSRRRDSSITQHLSKATGRRDSGNPITHHLPRSGNDAAQLPVRIRESSVTLSRTFKSFASGERLIIVTTSDESL